MGGHGCHHFLLSVFGQNPERVFALILGLQGILNLFFHPVEVAVRIVNGSDLPAALPVVVELERESIAVSRGIDGGYFVGSISHCHPLVNVEYSSSSFDSAAVDFDPGNQGAHLVIGRHDIRGIFSLSVPLGDHISGKFILVLPGTGNIAAL